jgi:hypothetical protein
MFELIRNFSILFTTNDNNESKNLLASGRIKLLKYFPAGDFLFSACHSDDSLLDVIYYLYLVHWISLKNDFILHVEYYYCNAICITLFFFFLQITLQVAQNFILLKCFPSLSLVLIVSGIIFWNTSAGL